MSEDNYSQETSESAQDDEMISDEILPLSIDVTAAKLDMMRLAVRLAELGLVEIVPGLLGLELHQRPAGSIGYRVSHNSTPALDDAMARAQGQLRHAHANRTNTHLKSSYADIAAVYDACRSACSDAGIAIVQTPWGDPDRGLIVTTRISHKGEWVEGDFPVRLESHKGLNNKQIVGVAITYVRRYALTSMLGIATGEDLDGEDGEDRGDSSSSAAPQNRWATAVGAFAEIGVKPPAMLAFIGRKTVGQVDNDDHDKLQALYRGLKARDPEVVAAFEAKV